MSLSLSIPTGVGGNFPDFRPRIVVLGTGGGGVNAVNNMIRAGLSGVEFCVANTDAQSLAGSLAEHRIQLGVQTTNGQGAGARPEVGRAAAEEQLPEIMKFLDGCDMLFIATGMGGGTGTGATPVIARAASEAGLLTVGVVTKPFTSEGPRRMRQAELGINDLQEYVNSLIVIPNQNLFRLAGEDLTLQEGYELADNVLMSGVRAITEAIFTPGLMNLDFADVRSIMSEPGRAKIGIGEAEGENRAIRATEAAISNPLLEDTQLRSAKALLIYVLGGKDLKMGEMDEIYAFIGNGVEGEPNIIPGSCFDSDMEGKIRVYVVATGIDGPGGSDGKRVNLSNVTPVTPRRNDAIDIPPAPQMAARPMPQAKTAYEVEQIPNASQPQRAAPGHAQPGPARGYGQGYGHGGGSQGGQASGAHGGASGPRPIPQGAIGGQRFTASANQRDIGGGVQGSGASAASGHGVNQPVYGHATPASQLAYSQEATARNLDVSDRPPDVPSYPTRPSSNHAAPTGIAGGNPGRNATAQTGNAARNIGAKIASPAPRGGSLTQRVTSVGRKSETADVSPAKTAANVSTPNQPPSPPSPHSPNESDDENLQIPPFLRRQAN